MARYTKVLKSLAHNAVGNKRIEAAAPAGNNFYVTGATLNNSDDVLTLAVKGAANVTVDLSHLAAQASPGGSDTQVQFNNGGAFAGDADMTFDGTNLTLANDLIVGRKVKHNGDENNYIEFTTDDMDFNIDSKSFMRFTEVGTSGDKIVFNEGSNNIDFRIESDDNANMFFMDAGSNRIGIGTASPDSILHINGAATQELRIQSSDSGAYSRVQLRSATDGYAQFNMGDSGADAAGGLVYTHSTDTLDIRAANTVQLSITDNLVTLGDGVVLAPHSSDNFTIDSPNGIILDGTSAANGVQYHDGGTELLRISNSSSNPIIRIMQDSKDLIFQQYDASEVMRIGDDKKVRIGNSSATVNHLIVERDPSDTTYTILHGKAKYPRIRLEDTQASATQDIWHLGNQMRFGTNAGSTTTAAMFVQNGQPSDGLNYGFVGLNSGVGMGTTSPINSARLSIVDTTRPLLLGYDGSNYVNFEVSSSGDFTIDAPDDIRLDAGGGDIVLRDDGSEYARLSNSSQDFIIQNTQNDKDIIFKTVDNTTTTEVMRIDGSESRVGIGLDTPTSKLHVKGTLDIQDGNQTILMGAGNSSTARSNDTLKLARVGLAHYHNAEEPVAMLYAASNGSDNTVVMGGGTSNMNAATKLQFATAANDATTAGTTRMQIGSDGKVGIGTTSPNSKMTVQGDLDIPRGSRFRAGSTDSNQGVDIYHNNDGSSAFNGNVVFEGRSSGGDVVFRNLDHGQDYKFYAENDSGTEQLIMKIDGTEAAVGIGEGSTGLTTANGAYLHVTGSSNLLANFLSSDGIGEIRVGDSSKYTRLLTAGNQFKIMPFDGVELMVLDGGTEKVGIGTNAPGEKLHVVGTSRVTGKAAFGGSTLPTNNGISVVDTIQLSEKGSSPTATTAWGTVWVSGSTPNKLYFTDDAGTAHDLTAGGGGTIGGTIASGKLAIGTGTDTIGNFVDALTESNSIYIGSNPTSTTSSADNNVALGISTLDAVTTGDRNTAVGFRAATDVTTGQDNTAIGKDAMYANTTSNYSTAVGSQAMGTLDGAGTSTAVGYFAMNAHSGDNSVAVGAYSMRTGSNAYNVAVGVSAMTKVSGGAGGVAVGYQSGYHPTGNYNTWVGYNAGFGTAAGSAELNVGIGREALMNINDGDNNTAIGYQAGKDISDGTENTLGGYLAGHNLTDGSYNTVLGTKALGAGTTASRNVAIGYHAMLEFVQGDTRNTAVGMYAMHRTESGSHNVAMGYNAMAGANSSYDSDYNVAIGSSTMYANEGGDYNTVVGYAAGNAITTGGDNVLIGSQAGYAMTTQSAATLVGYKAGLNNTASSLVAIGKNAAYSNTSGGENVAIGFQAAFANQTSDQNTIIGYNAAQNMTAGYNTFVGHNAGHDLTTGQYNVLMGVSAGANITGSEQNVILGAYAGRMLQASKRLIAIGYEAGYMAPTGYQVAIGHAALRNPTTATENVALGNEALNGAGSSTSNYNTAIGNYTLSQITSAERNVAVGYKALQVTTTGDDNVAVGIYAGDAITEAGDNVLVGKEAGTTLTTGPQNVFIGSEAGESAVGAGYNVAIGSDAYKTAVTGNYNIAIGKNAMNNGLVTTSHAIGIGYEALKNLTSATETVAIGPYAGDAITTGGDNTAVGHKALSTVSTGGGNTAMGREAMRDSSAGATGNTAIGVNTLFSSGTPTGSTALGWGAGYYPSGNYNTFLGYKAGYGDSTTRSAYANTAIGRDTMIAMTTANSNVAVGNQTFQNVTTAIRGVAIGFQAGSNVTTGDYNVLVGAYAGQLFGTHASNIAIGAFAGQNSTADNSTFIGQNVGYYLEGDHNIGIGRQPLQGLANSTAAKNIGMGYKTLYQADTGADENVAIGYQSMMDITTGTLNVAIGAYAATGNTTGQENVAIGHSALQENQEGDHIVAIGRYAAYNTNPTAGTGDSVVIGTQAGYTNTTGVQNTFIGHRAGYSNTTSNQQVFVGREAGYNHTEGTTNIFIGARSGYLNTTGANNTVVGHQALYNNVHGDRNTAIGYQALHSSTPSDGGGQNTAVGDRAGYTTSTGHSNVYMGYLAGYSLTDGERNVIVGHEAARYANTMDFSVVIGNNAGTHISGASEAIIIGRNTGYYVSGNRNTFVGTNAGFGRSDGTHATTEAVAIGRNAMYYNSTTNYCIAIGSDALLGASSSPYMTGDNNVAVGRQAGLSTSSGHSNTIVGNEAGYTNTTGNDNTLIGYKAGKTIDGGTGRNVMIGSQAGQSATTTDASTIIGYQAAGGSALTGDYNTAVGFQSGYALIGSVEGNVFLGHRAGYGATSGGYNTFLGYAAGQNVTTGAGNVIIGKNAGPSSTNTDSNKLYINNAAGTPLIGGDFSSFQVHMNANVGIGNTNPQAKLHLSAGSSSEPIILLENTNADNTPPGVTFYKNTASPASSDQIGSIKFDSEEATSSDRKTYWEIQARINDPTNTTPNGQLNFYGLDGDSPGFIHQFQFINSQFSVLNSDGIGPTITPTGTNGGMFKTAGQKMRLQAKSDSTGEIHMMANTVGIGTTSPQQALHVAGNITTNALDSEYRFGNRSDLLIRGHSDFDMELISPQDMAFSIDSDNNETAHKFLFKTNTTTPRSAGTTLMEISEAGDVTIAGGLGVTGSTLAVQREMKNDITTSTTLSDSYSVYQALADGGGVGTVTLTAPSSPSIGDTYLIVAGAFGNPGGGGAPTLTGLVRIIANTGQTINGVNTNITLMQSTALQPEYKTAHLVCVDTNTWVMTLSAQAPVA